jgi:holliday junction DNA helicase RuvA
MIALLSGKIAHKGISHIVLDTQGVGYRVFIPLTTFYELPDAGESVTLHIHTSVKEDAIHLFGFYTLQERELFQLMLSVSGIGPKAAMNILSGISAAELLEAISGGHLHKLVAIPGIGKKMAERLILELKDKAAKKMAADQLPAMDHCQKQNEMIREDVLSALVNLGYKAGTAKDALDKAASGMEGEPDMETLLKKALKILSG